MTEPVRDAPWWRTAVVYQVWPRSFADSDGDGVGDLRGLLGKLDHLLWLGVDVLWLCPVYPSPQVDNGYDISDYQAIDPLFGTLEDFDELVAAVHARGMRLVLDIVVNHTSNAHAWFQESRSSVDSPKRDWYWWYDQPPNAWESLFGGPAWQLDDLTGQYYLHTFAPEQPDLRWETPAVRESVIAMLTWWVERGVDGFRFDVISMVSKDLGDATGVLGFGPRLHDYLQDVARAVLDGRQLLTVGETPGVTVEQARRLTDPATGALDMVFAFDHMGLDHGASKWDPVPLRLTRVKACLAAWQQRLGQGWNSLYWDNHDQPRVVSRFGDDGPHRVASATTLATVLHLHRGTPFVYQGEELGMANPRFASLEDYRDVESLQEYARSLAGGRSPAQAMASLQRMSRDNARTPVQWDDSPAAGFTTGTPWIGVNPDYVTVNASAQRRDPHSVLSHYRRLIALRHDLPVVAHGDFRLLLPEDERVWAFTRRLGEVELLVVANCSAEEATPDLAGWASGQVVLANLPGGRADFLRPWESRVLLRGG